jgi:hypothetical protein
MDQRFQSAPSRPVDRCTLRAVASQNLSGRDMTDTRVLARVIPV